jgi:diadenosine tetraphosphate (Ap4A) HIT family hydrolase
VADHLKRKGLAEHFNVAKIGNKLPYYHIHLVFRKPNDEAWPEPIWCSENLTPNKEMQQKLKTLLADFYS